MGVPHYFTILLITICIFNFIESKEFVPVYMLSTQRINGKVPALHRLSESSFKDDILERLKDNPYVVVFAEPTLSPEDFRQRDQYGELVFKNLAKLKSSTKILYLPYVQNPVNAFKNLEASVAEVSVESLNENFQFPETDILIINLNDAKDDETRVDMLKRHDGIISSVFDSIRIKHDNVLAVYTASHTSWVGSEDVLHYRKTRQLLQEVGDVVVSVPVNFTKTANSFVYFTNAVLTTDKPKNVTLTVTSTTTTENNSIIVNLTSPEISVQMNFTKDISLGYYQLIVPIDATINTTTYLLNVESEIYAPLNFSYHCGDQTFTNDSKDSSVSLLLKNFQIQIFYYQLPENATQFNDAYDCVGFTSIPIWSGLFVTTILLIIMSLGITMMMDIRTMDRFDDAKGKTITINTSE